MQRSWYCYTVSIQWQYFGKLLLLYCFSSLLKFWHYQKQCSKNRISTLLFNINLTTNLLYIVSEYTSKHWLEYVRHYPSTVDISRRCSNVEIFRYNKIFCVSCILMYTVIYLDSFAPYTINRKKGAHFIFLALDRRLMCWILSLRVREPNC
jgi:hypothetical protein